MLSCSAPHLNLTQCRIWWPPFGATETCQLCFGLQRKMDRFRMFSKRVAKKIVARSTQGTPCSNQTASRPFRGARSICSKCWKQRRSRPERTDNEIQVWDATPEIAHLNDVRSIAPVSVQAIDLIRPWSLTLLHPFHVVVDRIKADQIFWPIHQI